MMKLNNKGMTLMELLISIVLESIVVIFLLQLLNDLEHETKNNNYAYNNQVNRFDLVYTIKKDFQKYNLVGVKDVSSEGNLKIEFCFQKDAKTKCSLLSSEYIKGSNESNDKYYDYDLVVTKASREENKKIVIDFIKEKLLEIL